MDDMLYIELDNGGKIVLKVSDELNWQEILCICYKFRICKSENLKKSINFINSSKFVDFVLRLWIILWVESDFLISRNVSGFTTDEFL